VPFSDLRLINAASRVRASHVAGCTRDFEVRVREHALLIIITTMSLPTAYLTSQKNLKSIFEAMQAAQAPKKFTISFLESLGFKNTSDRLIIGVLKSLGFLTPAGEPTTRYYEFLDQTQSNRVLADGVRDAYADLFQVNTRANELSNTEVKNKLKTLTQGQFTESVLDKMAATFKSLSVLADFAEAHKPQVAAGNPTETQKEPLSADSGLAREISHPPVKLGGLVYNIQIHLPESRDPAVYDALFRSFKDHLLR
jgi:hypothetical protein